LVIFAKVYTFGYNKSLKRQSLFIENHVYIFQKTGFFTFHLDNLDLFHAKINFFLIRQSFSAKFVPKIAKGQVFGKIVCVFSCTPKFMPAKVSALKAIPRSAKG